MIHQILIGCALMFATTLVHSGFTILVLHVLRALGDQHRARRSTGRGSLLVASLVMGMFLIALVEVMLWAGTYLWIGALSHLEEAVYFSMVTFTTLGYGEIVLSESWRLLASFEAANGIMLFGWTTALIVALVQRLARRAPSK